MVKKHECFLLYCYVSTSLKVVIEIGLKPGLETLEVIMAQGRYQESSSQVASGGDQGLGRLTLKHVPSKEPSRSSGTDSFQLLDVDKNVLFMAQNQSPSSPKQNDINSSEGIS